MAYITNKKRNKLIDATNNNYALRKTLIVITIILFIIVVAMLIYCSFKTADYYKTLRQTSDLTEEQVWLELSKQWYSLVRIVQPEEGELLQVYLSVVSIVLLTLLSVAIAFGIVSIVLVLAFKSPKAVSHDISVLEESPLSGKKIKRSTTATKIVSERKTTPESSN